MSLVIFNYQKNQHVENIGLNCKMCEEECTYIKQIQEHEKEQHTIATEFKCEDCEGIFKSEKN